MTAQGNLSATQFKPPALDDIDLFRDQCLTCGYETHGGTCANAAEVRRRENGEGRPWK